MQDKRLEQRLVSGTSGRPTNVVHQCPNKENAPTDLHPAPAALAPTACKPGPYLPTGFVVDKAAVQAAFAAFYEQYPMPASLDSGRGGDAGIVPLEPDPQSKSPLSRVPDDTKVLQSTTCKDEVAVPPGRKSDSPSICGSNLRALGNETHAPPRTSAAILGRRVAFEEYKQVGLRCIVLIKVCAL